MRIAGDEMKKLVIFAALLLAVSGGSLLALPAEQSQPAAQTAAQTPAQTAAAPKACQDLEGGVVSVTQGLAAMVQTVKKESQDDFERQYHQQVVGSRLSIGLSMTNDLLDCLDKAGKDPATSKTDAAAIKTSQAAYTKLKSTLAQDQQTLKAAKDPKTAKADIEAFDFPKSG